MSAAGGPKRAGEAPARQPAEALLCIFSGVCGGDSNPGPGFVFCLLFHRVKFFFDGREALQDFVHAHRHVADGFDLRA